MEPTPNRTCGRTRTHSTSFSTILLDRLDRNQGERRRGRAKTGSGWRVVIARIRLFLVRTLDTAFLFLQLCPTCSAPYFTLSLLSSEKQAGFLRRDGCIAPIVACEYGLVFSVSALGSGKIFQLTLMLPPLCTSSLIGAPLVLHPISNYLFKSLSDCYLTRPILLQLSPSPLPSCGGWVREGRGGVSMSPPAILTPTPECFSFKKH